jgi:hypothetical protein
MARSRRARASDIGEVALGLPQVEEGSGRDGRPSFSAAGRTFVFFREPRPDAVDPEDGARLTDVVAFRVADRDDKEALLASGGPWFTTPHWNGYNAVLVRERDVPRLSLDELTEVVTDAWLAMAPKRLAAEFLARG